MSNSITQEQADWILEKIKEEQKGQIIYAVNAQEANRILSEFMAHLENALNKCVGAP